LQCTGCSFSCLFWVSFYTTMHNHPLLTTHLSPTTHNSLNTTYDSQFALVVGLHAQVAPYATRFTWDAGLTVTQDGVRTPGSITPGGRALHSVAWDASSMYVYGGYSTTSTTDSMPSVSFLIPSPSAFCSLFSTSFLLSPLFSLSSLDVGMIFGDFWQYNVSSQNWTWLTGVSDALNYPLLQLV
jgi:hypothetical protein